MTAFVLTFITGLIWAGVGIAFSIAAQQRIQIMSALTCAIALQLPIVFFSFPDYAALAQMNNVDYMPLALLMIAAGGAGMAAMLVVQTAMRIGHNGMVWSIAQSALLIPFVLGITCFAQAVLPWQYMGVLCIVLSLIIFATCQGTGASQHLRAFVLSLLAFALLGMEQSLKSLPNYLSVFSDQANLRLPFAVLGSALLIFPYAYRQLRQGSWQIGKTEAIWAVVLNLLILPGQYVLYWSLDEMSALGYAALVFPIAISVCILGFAVFSAWQLQEERSPRHLCALASVLLGVILISFH